MVDFAESPQREPPRGISDRPSLGCARRFFAAGLRFGGELSSFVKEPGVPGAPGVWRGRSVGLIKRVGEGERGDFDL